MSLSGNLSDFSLIEIIKLLNNLKKTGILKISASGEFAGENAEIHFKNGEIIFSITNKGISGKNVILHAFEYKEGAFSFEETANINSKNPNVKESTESLVMEGSRFITEWSKLSKEIKSLSLVVKLSPNPPTGVSEIELSKEEWKVLRLIDGKKSIRRIAEELKMPDFEVGKIIYGLISSGLVEKVGEEAGFSGAAVELFAKGKPEFYLVEDVVYVDSELIKKWKKILNGVEVARIIMHLPSGTPVAIRVKPREGLKNVILIPEEIMKELSINKRDKIVVEPVK